jgi:hypothetical protein
MKLRNAIYSEYIPIEKQLKFTSPFLILSKQILNREQCGGEEYYRRFTLYS